MLQKIKDEPVLFGGLLVASYTLLAAFGLELSGEQTASTTAFVFAVVSFIVRQNVSPVEKHTVELTVESKDSPYLDDPESDIPVEDDTPYGSVKEF